MRRRRTAEYLLALVLAALMLLSGGCVWLGEALSKASATDAPAPAETEAPEWTAAPSSIENPVFAMFSEYSKLRAKGAKGLTGAVYDSEEELPRILLLRLLNDESMLSGVFASVGMLSRDNAQAAYTGSLTGAYAGSGELLGDGSFSFDFDSGKRITGSFEGRKGFRCDLTEGGVTYHLMFFRSEEGFILRVVSGGETGILEITADGLKYACGPSSLIKGDSTGAEFPTAEGLSYLYWSAGALSCEER